MLDSGGISRVYRNKDGRKVINAFYFLFTKTDAGGQWFCFISSERVDFKKRRKGAK